MSPRSSTLEPARGAPRGPSSPEGPRGWRRDDDHDGAARPPAGASSIAVWLLVGAITILFGAFTSTFLARRGEADWQTGPLPPILWLSTAALLASSLAIEWARRRGRHGRVDQMWAGLVITAALGAAFLGTQLLAWRQLVAAGVYLTTNPHGAFFYLLTAMHGLHLAGGLAALAYAV
ncbi:MAG: cytochrome c oxidase subunit 3, partial [bacterium]